ncbi:MAG: LuxR C-terminal-related transcriptional regulator, partial [Lachnospiraceae bacterium]
EKAAMQTICDQIELDVNDDDSLNEIAKGRYLAELEFVRSYMSFNDYKTMHEHYVLARNYSRLPITLLPNRYPYNFQIPSVLTLYYNETGKMKEIADFIDETISDYYLLTYGHGKGSNSLLRAELNYLTGDIKAAEIHCYHAIYQAESRNQYSIMIAAYMYLCKAALMNGNYEGYSTYREAMEAVYNDAVGDNMQYHLKMEIDIADAVISSMLGEVEKFPEWLKDSLVVERSGNLVTLCYVFILHARYLYEIGDYDKILGISSQMLGIADVYKSPLTKLKANIVIAAACLANMESDNAEKYFKDAIYLAYQDDLIMPFVENYSMIEHLLDRFNTTNREINMFIKKIRAKARALNSCVNKCTKIVKNQNNHGLTPREAEIARLAAQRYSNRQIAGQLFIAESTVKSAMKIIFNKLGISSRQELEEVL